MHIVFRVVLQRNKKEEVYCKGEESRYDHANKKNCSAEFLSHFHDGLFRSAASGCSTIDRPLRLIDGIVHVAFTLTYYLTLTLLIILSRIKMMMTNNSYTAVLLFVLASVSVDAVSIRGGTSNSSPNDFEQGHHRTLAPPTCTNGKSSLDTSQGGCNAASGGGSKELPCCTGLICDADGSCVEPSQTCPEQYCPAVSPISAPNVDQCSLSLESLAIYTAPGTSDVLIELKGPSNPSDALNLVIAAPHGGSLKPGYISDRSGNGIVTSKDSYTLEMAELMAQSVIDSHCEGVPYVIINHLHRSKLDANREIDEATAGITTGLDVAIEAWTHFHTYVNDAQLKVKDKFGSVTGSTGIAGVRGVMFDMHGYKGNNADTGSTPEPATTGWIDDTNIAGAPFTQFGYRLSDSPSLTSCPLDGLSDGSTTSTIGSLTHARWLPNQSYECLVRGPNSMGSRVNALLNDNYVTGISALCGQSTPSYEYPSPNELATDVAYCHDATGGGECHYYSGGFDVNIHERMDLTLATNQQETTTFGGEHFNTMQAELPRCIRFGGSTIREEFANVLGMAMMQFLSDLYG